VWAEKRKAAVGNAKWIFPVTGGNAAEMVIQW
jgi:hypothetical protein